MIRSKEFKYSRMSNRLPRKAKKKMKREVHLEFVKQEKLLRPIHGDNWLNVYIDQSTRNMILGG